MKIVKSDRSNRYSKKYSAIGTIILLVLFTPALLIVLLTEPRNPIIILFILLIVVFVLFYHLGISDLIIKRILKIIFFHKNHSKL